MIPILLMLGCKTTKIEYKVVPADRYQYPMTNEYGVSGWFVPDVVHADLMEAITKVNYYEKLIDEGK